MTIFIHRILLLATILVGSIFQPALAYCIDNWACFTISRHQDGVDVFLENKKAFVVTSTIAVDADNLQIQGQAQYSFEATEVLQGFETKKVLSLKKVDLKRRYQVRHREFRWTPGNLNAQHNDSYVYEKPFAEGEDYRVIQGYGGSWSHRGASRYALDFDMPVGTPVHASRGGVVIDLTEHHNKGGANRRYARYANFVTILHDDDTTGEYYHLKQNGVVVELGDSVKKGDLIGYSGNTGFSSMPHLHFAVYKAESHGRYQSIPVNFSTPVNLPKWLQRGYLRVED